MNKHFRGALPLLVAAIALANAPDASAQVAPPLGVADQFGALGNSGVTGSTGAGTQVTGDVGSSPTATITNFGPSTVVGGFTLHTTNNLTVIQAHADAIVAFNQMTGQPGGVLTLPQLNGVTLTSGVYDFAAQADLANGGTLTLNGPGVFIFRVTTALTMNTNSNVVGSANPCNVFWQVGTSATLNGITFRGTVIADASISLASTGNVTGRLLAGTGATGAVTMAGAGGNTIGGCSTAPVVPPIPPGPPPVPALPDFAAAGLLAVLLVSGVVLARR